MTTYNLVETFRGSKYKLLTDDVNLLIKVYVGKSSKCMKYNKYPNEDIYLKAIKSYIEADNLEILTKEKNKKDHQDRITAFKNKLQVGTILTDSWGYEQTQVEFYIVTEINDKKTECTIREIGCISSTKEGNSAMSDYVMPDTNKSIGPPIKKRIVNEGFRIDSSIFLTMWDGRSQYRSWYY